jgi:hypothetical protein
MPGETPRPPSFGSRGCWRSNRKLGHPSASNIGRQIVSLLNRGRVFYYAKVFASNAADRKDPSN